MPARSSSTAAPAPNTSANADRLAGAAGCQAYILEGGIDAWKKAGLPVAVDRGQPIEIMRQMQITAGALVLLGVLLGLWVAPAFLALSGFMSTASCSPASAAGAAWRGCSA